MSNVKFQMPLSIRLNFCRSVPPELLRSFFSLARESPFCLGRLSQANSQCSVSPADGVGVGCIEILTILSFLNAMLGRITLRSHKPWDMSVLGTPRHPQPYHHNHYSIRWSIRKSKLLDSARLNPALEASFHIFISVQKICWWWSKGTSAHG